MTTEKVDVIIYRMRETGLEVFMVHEAEGEPAGNWNATETLQCSPDALGTVIELDSRSEGEPDRKLLAVEADWHQIPSLRALIYEDYRVAKEKAKMHMRNIIPSMDRSGFVAVKEAFKRIMPHQYAYLKELKEVLQDKEQTRYI
jgi:predicted NUDIX family NTP pyrophosphohydrolase